MNSLHGKKMSAILSFYCSAKKYSQLCFGRMWKPCNYDSYFVWIGSSQWHIHDQYKLRTTKPWSKLTVINGTQSTIHICSIQPQRWLSTQSYKVINCGMKLLFYSQINGETVDVWNWIINFTLLFPRHVITYPQSVKLSLHFIPL